MQLDISKILYTKNFEWKFYLKLSVVGKKLINAYDIGRADRRNWHSRFAFKNEYAR